MPNGPTIAELTKIDWPEQKPRHFVWTHDEPPTREEMRTILRAYMSGEFDSITFNQGQTKPMPPFVDYEAIETEFGPEGF